MARNANSLTQSEIIKAQNLAEQCLWAYPQGYFPMAKPENPAQIEWIYPYERGVLPLSPFSVSRSLRRQYRQQQAKLTLSYQHFSDVIFACAQREETWISPLIHTAFHILHEQGHAHSLAVFYDGRMIGGVYGLAMGGAFFGESMFSHETGGSKLALWALRAHLSRLGFVLFDTQFLTEHLESLGGYALDHEDYLKALERAMQIQPESLFQAAQNPINWHEIMNGVWS